MKLSILFSLVGLGAALDQAQPRPTKCFELNLSWGASAPDGVQRKHALINGQFPGPPLVFDEGDSVEVTVNNFLPFNTTIHWHGIEQLGTSWSDGVPGVSQKLIVPGGSFVAKFTATQYGTYWYHSHVAGQIMDGLFGPVYIRPKNIPRNLARMISSDTSAQSQINHAIRNPKLLTVSDWFHNTSEELREISLAANIDALCADSILLNGKGRVRCVDSAYLTSQVPPESAPLLQGMNYTAKGCLPLGNTYAQTNFGQHNFSAVPPTMFDRCKATESAEEVIPVDPRKGWASLNFISSASISAPIVSINNHSLWIYEIDGQYIVPQKVHALTLSNGARYSALVQLNKTPGKYQITAANAGLNQKIAGYGILSYVNGDPSVKGKPAIDYSGFNTSTDVVLFDENKIKPFIPSPPNEEVDETYLLTIGRIHKAWKWSLNGDYAYRLSLESEKPMLWNPQSHVNSSLVIATKNNTWVDLIFAVSGGPAVLQPGHPLHKHSNRVYVIGAGTGLFNWTSVAEARQEIPEMFNLIDPPMRDTFTTPPALNGPSWMAVRYQVQNPGAFFLHCHIDPHLTGGMALAILDGVDTWPEIPPQYGPKGHWGRAKQ